MIILTLFAVLLTFSNSYDLSIFYCGFSKSYCGHSVSDDVYSKANTVILAFAHIASSGKAVMDENHFPSDQVRKWKRDGKRVLLSVGGQNVNWQPVFVSKDNRNNFVSSVVNYVGRFDLDGIDLAILTYLDTPRQVAQMIIDLKSELLKKGRKILVVSPEDITIYQGVFVPDPDTPGKPYNYFVPIINLADSSIDYYQPQAYNNAYVIYEAGSIEYFEDVYLNWRNMQGLAPWYQPIPNFAGVKGSKLMMGLMASPSAGVEPYYGKPEIIGAFKDWIESNNYDLKGFMIWNSHWDKQNNNTISKVCKP